MTTTTLGALVQEFFLSHLIEQKGLRQSSVRSYRDTLRLFLQFAAADAHRQVSQLTLRRSQLRTGTGVSRHLEQQRHNGIATRNQRLGALHTFFEFVARRDPDRLRECQQIAAIPVKRSAQPTMYSLTREEVQSLFAGLSDDDRLTLRDRALLLFFYNTGARCRKLPVCGSNNSPWITRRMCVYTGRATSGATVRCGRRPQVSFGASSRPTA